MTVTPTDLGTYLGVAIDPGDDRAMLLIDMASKLCASVVADLTNADPVILDVAARAYTNPQNVAAQGVGPYSATYGSVGGGLWLTRQNKATLRRLHGGGGAFTIDVTPAATPPLPWWELNTWGFGDGLVGEDWDQIP